VNLACKAILGAITNMDLAANSAGDYIPSGTCRDPVAALRTVIQKVRVYFLIYIFKCSLSQTRGSSLRRQYFSSVVMQLQQRNLQLIRDVDTRWSSTLLMIERALILRIVRV
jgi:hypothetical protein